MKLNMPNRLAVLLAILVFFTVFPGCAAKKKEQGEIVPLNTSADGTEENKLPISAQTITLTYFTALNSYAAASMKSYAEMACFKELETRTGVHIEFLHFPESEANNQFNAMIASQNLPDIIYWNWSAYPGGAVKALEEKKIINLNSYVNQYAPNIKKLIGSDDEARKSILTNDGAMYCFPYLATDPYLTIYGGPVIRKDWLDKLNLKLPVTINDWHEVLKAFKDKDPNGNGKKDEIPFSPNSLGSSTYAFDSTSFIGAWGIDMTFYNEDGKVRFGPLQPQFKDFLTEMNKWYNEGLIDQGYVEADRKNWEAKVTGGQLGSFVGLASGMFGKYNAMMAASNPKFKLSGTAYPVLNAGDKAEFSFRKPEFNGLGAAVSSSCKNVKEAVKWLDYMYSNDGHMLVSFGIEGTSYKMDSSGNPKFTDDVIKNSNGLTYAAASARYCLAAIGGPFVQDKRVAEQFSEGDVQKEAINLWMQPSNKKLLPPVTLTAEEELKSAASYQNINLYVKEAVNNFITGKEPLVNFDKFTEKLKEMGAEDLVKIYQGALDRYNKH